MSEPLRAAAPSFVLSAVRSALRFARRGSVPALAAALLFGAAPLHASTEEFSTFDVARPEEDDESLLDHLLIRPPRAWDSEWRAAPMAVRTQQGCLTSGQWLNVTRLRVHSPLGERARLGVDLDISETDYAFWNQIDFSFEFPQSFGTPGVSFRPFFDKSRQDFALTYEAGSDTSRFVARAVFTFEDMFNNLWAWRQTRVGDVSEPYEQHPYEPAFRAGIRRDHWRAEMGGKWLTPSRRQEPGPVAPLSQHTTLWGTLGEARLEVDALSLTFGAGVMDKQARSSADAFLDPAGGPYTPADSLAADVLETESWRRHGTAELSGRRGFGRWNAELRWIYQLRKQNVDAGRFIAHDRAVQLEVTRPLMSALDLRLGGIYDRVDVTRDGVRAPREETRLYFGLDARFGQVRVFGIEGIELDSEPYEVWFIHDKGFLGLQATF